MDDLISQKAAIKGKISIQLSNGLEIYSDEAVPVEYLKRLPTAQPEIIRCKDCKYGSPNGKYGCRVYHYRRYETHDMEPDDFCSRAERRTDDEG